ncbi:MAG: RtcB family protein, partial [Minisyncoccales bacterium]
TELSRRIPSGLGRGSPFQVSDKEFKKILTGGAEYLVKQGYGKKDDYLHLEEEGKMEGADWKKVSDRAIRRGIGQLGTLGSGNHFLDVQVVDEIFDSETARAFGLEKDQVVIMIHCGSRGLGHQIASDYIKKMSDEYGEENFPDKQLISAPVNSELGKEYYAAMACAVNFAFANKQLMVYWIRDELKRILPKSEVEVVYDVCHNIAKFEEYDINGKKQKICVHRKGATRAFGPGRKEIPKVYRKVGQPVLIPGSMGTASYVLVGTREAEKLTFGSTVHGAGRVMSRSKALKKFTGEEVMKELENKGIIIKSSSMKSFTQEVPAVYKDIGEVVNTVHNLGISKKVAKLKPEIVVIG